MAADRGAKYYQWYMDVSDDTRIVMFEWWPEGQFISSSMTFGKLNLKVRDEPTDEWGPPKLIAQVPWTVAQRLARDQGFTVEVPVYG